MVPESLDTRRRSQGCEDGDEGEEEGRGHRQGRRRLQGKRELALGGNANLADARVFGDDGGSRLSNRTAGHHYGRRLERVLRRRRDPPRRRGWRGLLRRRGRAHALRVGRRRIAEQGHVDAVGRHEHLGRIDAVVDPADGVSDGELERSRLQDEAWTVPRYCGLCVRCSFSQAD